MGKKNALLLVAVGFFIFSFYIFLGYFPPKYVQEAYGTGECTKDSQFTTCVQAALSSSSYNITAPWFLGSWNGSALLVPWSALNSTNATYDASAKNATGWLNSPINGTISSFNTYCNATYCTTNLWNGGGGGSATPAGSTEQVQFNNGGSFAGDSEFRYNQTGKYLFVGSNATGAEIITNGGFTGGLTNWANDYGTFSYGSNNAVFNGTVGTLRVYPSWSSPGVGWYQYSYTITGYNGTASNHLYFGSNPSGTVYTPNVYGNGVFTGIVYLTNAQPISLQVVGTASSFVVDDISMKRIGLQSTLGSAIFAPNFVQNGNLVIDTSTIAAQSVNYANTAGSAPNPFDQSLNVADPATFSGLTIPIDPYNSITIDATNGFLINNGGTMASIDITGSMFLAGSFTATGGSDPPYELYFNETREHVLQLVRQNVPAGREQGMIHFYNSVLSRWEDFKPANCHLYNHSMTGGWDTLVDSGIDMRAKDDIKPCYATSTTRNYYWDGIKGAVASYDTVNSQPIKMPANMTINQTTGTLETKLEAVKP